MLTAATQLPLPLAVALVLLPLVPLLQMLPMPLALPLTPPLSQWQWRWTPSNTRTLPSLKGRMTTCWQGGKPMDRDKDKLGRWVGTSQLGGEPGNRSTATPGAELVAEIGGKRGMEAANIAPAGTRAKKRSNQK